MTARRVQVWDIARLDATTRFDRFAPYLDPQRLNNEPASDPQYDGATLRSRMSVDVTEAGWQIERN